VLGRPEKVRAAARRVLADEAVRRPPAGAVEPDRRDPVLWQTVITASALGKAYFIAEYHRQSSSSSSGVNSWG
jgi:hypothetical protein